MWYYVYLYEMTAQGALKKDGLLVSPLQLLKVPTQTTEGSEIIDTDQ